MTEIQLHWLLLEYSQSWNSKEDAAAYHHVFFSSPTVEFPAHDVYPATCTDPVTT
jgi:hypothetical protein